MVTGTVPGRLRRRRSHRDFGAGTGFAAPKLVQDELARGGLDFGTICMRKPLPSSSQPKLRGLRL